MMTPGTRVGPYEILAPLGAGGMGEVYRARDTKLDREVAVKVLPEALAQNPERLARFEREAKVLASLNHPNIAQIYGVEDRALVMELVAGASPKGPLPFEEAWKIASQIAEALDYAHERGVIHRDLKPANVKVTPDGVVKLLDFGLAKAYSEAPDSTSSDPANSPTLTMGATVAGVILGTAAYMAPEQARGKNVDRRADIWSFGVVLYELLTGRQLFQGDDLTEILASVVKEPADLSAVPERARKLLEACLQKDPRKRLQAIGDVRYLLESGEKTQAPQGMAPRHRASWAAAGVLGIAAAWLAVVHFRESPPPERSLRYTLPLPERAALQSLALSPDGRYLAIAFGVNRSLQMWLRPLDALQAQPLPTTEGGYSPFWSPDSRSIGFFAQGKLRKISVGGGPSLPICDGPSTSVATGTWNQDGVILFSQGEAAVKRVSAEGGVAADLNGVNGGLPMFLPDGRHFLYGVARTGVSVASVDAGERRRVSEPLGAPATFAITASGGRTGYVLLRRQTSLVARPFDLASLQFSGDTFPVAENVSPTLFTVTASRNGVLVYASATGGGATNQLVWYDRSGKATPVGPRGDLWEPAISPDEKTIAFSRDGDIRLLDLAHGQVERRLTTDAAQSDAPVWAPGGDRLIYRSTRSGRQELYQRAASEAGQDELLSTTPNQKFASQWTAAGVILVTDNPGNGLDLWYLPAGQGQRKPVKFLHTGFREAQGQLSPDGRWIAFASDRSGQREIYVRPFPTGEGEWRVSVSGGEQPRWRADGKELFFVGADGKMMSASVKPAPGAKPQFEWSVPVPLFETRIASAPITSAFQYDVTRDGKRFLVATNGSGGAETAPSITVWVNWIAALKK